MMTTQNAVGVRAVLGGAYKASSPKSMLTHAVEIDGQGWEVRALCSRVDVDNLCDAELTTAPTCPVCAKRAAK